MPRPQITTTFTPRVKPTTDWNCPRCIKPRTWDTTEIKFDSTLFTFDVTATWGLQTSWGTPRKEALITLADDSIYLFADSERVELAGGAESNILKTIWN